MKSLYGKDAAASELGVGLTTVYHLVKGGKLKAVKLGRRTLITGESLAAYIASLPDAIPATGHAKAAA